jgi:hypothetical protein
VTGIAGELVVRPHCAEPVFFPAVAALIDQLRQLREDLRVLVDSDEEQEVQAPALSTVDAVLREAREQLPADSTLSDQITDIISAEFVAQGQGIRAAELLILTGQLLAVLERDERRRREDAAAHHDQDLATWNDIRASVPRDGPIEFLEHHPWEYSFTWDKLEPLERYRARADLPDCMFFDTTLEDDRQAFLDAVDELWAALNKTIGAHANIPDRYRMFPFADLDWETPETAHIFTELRRVSKLSSTAVEAHDRLWDTARRRLGV